MFTLEGGHGSFIASIHQMTMLKKLLGTATLPSPFSHLIHTCMYWRVNLMQTQIQLVLVDYTLALLLTGGHYDQSLTLSQWWHEECHGKQPTASAAAPTQTRPLGEVSNNYDSGRRTKVIGLTLIYVHYAKCACMWYTWIFPHMGSPS